MKKIINYTLILAVALTGIIACSSDEENVTGAEKTKDEKTGENTTTPDDESKLFVTKGTYEFGKVAINVQKTLNVTIHNKGKSTLEVNSVVYKGSKTEFSTPGFYGKLEAGKSVSFDVTFMPKSVGVKSYEIEFVTNDGVKKITFKGTCVASGNTGSAFDIDKSSLDFGDSVVGTGQKELLLVISNNSKKTLGLNSITLLGKNESEFKTSLSNVVGYTDVEPGKKLTIKVWFTPISGGNKTAQLYLGSTDGNKTINITAKAIDKIVLSKSVLDFGIRFTADYAKVLSFNIHNLLTTNLTIKSVTFDGNDSSMFTSDLNVSTSINANHKENIDVSFKPTSKGGITARLILDTNYGKRYVTMKGTGK